MFAERLNQLMECIQLSSADLAKQMQCDTSNISRMCSGARVPKYGGNASIRLIEGLFMCATSSGSIPAMCRLIGCDHTTVPEEIRRYLVSWLYDGSVIHARAAVEQPYRSFGERLDAVMRLTELSNVRFGKMISMDASYISRFRNGLRSPRSNPDAVHAICRILYERICQQERLDGLEKLMGHPLPDEKNAAFREFSEWLCDFTPGQQDPAIEGLLETIDTYQPAPAPPLPETKDLPEQVLYTGSRGLRDAVLRFLTEALQKAGRELWLYSDMHMDWMTEEPAFLQKWSALMLACLRSGIQVRIIHNVDRSQGELLSAIRSWLPLYMAGNISSFSLRSEEYERFSHTLFLCPGIACIEGFHPAGCAGLFRYHSAGKLMGTFCDMFSALCSKAVPLVQIGHAAPVKYLEQSSLTVIGTSLSFATMPRQVLQSALSRCRISERERRKIEANWADCHQALLQQISSSTVDECCPLASDEALFGGSVQMELPDASLFYTPKEYAEHIRAILALSDSHRNFRFYPMPEAAFPNTLLLLTRDLVTVSRINTPRVIFRISHPVLCDAFLTYAERIKAQHEVDKAALRSQMERYL